MGKMAKICINFIGKLVKYVKLYNGLTVKNALPLGILLSWGRWGGTPTITFSFYNFLRAVSPKLMDLQPSIYQNNLLSTENVSSPIIRGSR